MKGAVIFLLLSNVCGEQISVQSALRARAEEAGGEESRDMDEVLLGKCSYASIKHISSISFLQLLYRYL